MGTLPGKADPGGHSRTMIMFKACSKCSGDLYFEQDHEGTYMLCLMCGFVSYPGVALVLRDRVVDDRSLVVWSLPAYDALPKREASAS